MSDSYANAIASAPAPPFPGPQQRIRYREPSKSERGPVECMGGGEGLTEVVLQLPRPEGPAHLPFVPIDLPHGEGPRVFGPPAAPFPLREVIALTEVGKPVGTGQGTRQKRCSLLTKLQKCDIRYGGGPSSVPVCARQMNRHYTGHPAPFRERHNLNVPPLSRDFTGITPGTGSPPPPYIQSLKTAPVRYSPRGCVENLHSSEW